jgi:hypothetical protein
MNLTGKQILSIVAAVVSALMLATTQLTDIFGPSVAKSIVSVAALTNMILNSVVVALTGQATLVKDVAAMPGVEKITVNSGANQVLAAVASDPQVSKVGGTSASVQQVLIDKAKGG